MFKDSKINKSPIQSILQESFEQEPSGYNPRNAPPSHQSFHGEHTQFKISSSHYGANIQEKLKIVKLISIAQIQISLDAIAQIVKNKTLNSTSQAMLRLKRAEPSKNGTSILYKTDKSIVIRKIQLFHNKLATVFAAKRLRNLGTGFLQISLLRIKNLGFDKSSSIVSPYRGYQKVQGSDRGDSEWEMMAQSQGQLSTHQNLTKENKFLKRKRDKMKSQREEFCSKIDEILSAHEVFLYKK